MRACFICGEPISDCMGFVLARDFLRLLAGEHIMPREHCGRCAIRYTTEQIVCFADQK